MSLTRRQAEVLDVIREFIAENRYTPSLEEIAAALNLSSVATVHKHISLLAEKGYLRKNPHTSRSVELVDMVDQAPPPGAVVLPYVGVIAAGRPMLVFESEQAMTVPDMFEGYRGTFILRVEGDSMIGAHIDDGDYVIVEQNVSPQNGEITVARLPDGEVTLKRFFDDGEKIRLQPENNRFEPFVLNRGEVEVQGVVIGVLRKY